MRIYLVAGEPSGDQLGASLMRALRARLGDGVELIGVGGEAMTREGMQSLFPLSDIGVVGLRNVLGRLPTILRRAYSIVDDVAAKQPDVVVIIDAPDFTHPVAKRIHRRLPDLPIVNYVSPTVWAWRPGRAKTMRGYIAHVMALMPFEPEAHLRLGGPPCTYVGHPLIERIGDLRPGPEERRPLGENPLELLVLPGSRPSEVRRLMDTFGKTLERLWTEIDRPFAVTIPAVSHLADDIRRRAESWPFRPRIVEGESAKLEAFRRAHLALAASGTVTLELALSGVPMVVAYRVSGLEGQLRFLVKVPSVVLANLVIGENVVPEFIQEDCTPEKLAPALLALAKDSPDRQRQIEAFGRLDAIMEASASTTPSERAAALVVAEVERALSTAGAHKPTAG
ncbi:lipid-A-disaccharide synthase [Enterovirga rhinocerotis]|uniref:Lipid-A-disaccharide synthase n=1 Tax=Enterovirga rhinocerotis TaxID=1339210 RepID=A0A4V3DYR4_9HYPH|nr:lipid-A-disaccharide synthase [Enterovirga rhinocerotis]TDR93589.1 lipid-A-disaccharide synthase [Enterovirga rhinocerotis]